MPFRREIREHVHLGWYVLKWLLIIAPVAACIGSVVAFFLWALDLAIRTRWEHPWLFYLLPVAGIAIVLSYGRWGRSVETGNNLIMDQIHEPGGGVPLRMAPFVLFGTIITHLFGGSAGREGTAVQIGGSIASAFRPWLRLNDHDYRTLLTAGVAAGFGAVFGTPLAGAVFAIEVLRVGRMRYDALVPCLAAAVIADQVCLAWGINHTHYRIDTAVEGEATNGYFRLNAMLALKVALAAAAFGLASAFFSQLSHALTTLYKRFIKREWLRPVAAAFILFALVWILGTRDYLGLGVTTQDGQGVSIMNAFKQGGADPFSWFWKIVFTAVTLASGFKGGEVTPLFFIGATLGNTLGILLGAPVALFAAIGFISVFAGATNTPLACTIMGIELFGAEYTVYFAIGCFLAYLFSGHTGIYSSQRKERKIA